MLRRLTATSVAGTTAIVLALFLTGVVAAASILTAVAAPQLDPTEPTVVDTTATFEDLDGDGVDDDCQDAVVGDEAAAAAADAAVDADADGTISVSEAAQSDRTGGKSCNHGGYVNGVAHETCDDADNAVAETEGSGETDEVNADEASTDDSDATDDSDSDGEDASAPAADCPATDEEQPAEETQADAPTTCDAAPVSEDESTDPTDTGDTPRNHGAVVSEVAKSADALGGKNCNHGGAVSDASHKDNEARKVARDAAKAARAAERAARAAERAVKHASHGKGHK